MLDTNAVINYLGASLPNTAMQKLNTIVDEEPIVSIVTKMEALGFNFKSVAEQNTVEIFINNSFVLDISNDIVNKTIEIRKAKKIDLPDAIIAATACVHNLVLVSRNISDFKNIKGLQIIDPHSL